MNARTFFMTGSGRSLLRSSSYEKGTGLAPYAAISSPRCLAGALLAGCGTLPTNVGKTDSSALPPNPESPLVKIAASSTPSPEQTGVRLLPLGAYSLDTRIQLAQRATTSLDVQYYELENDPTGRLLMTALRDASAARRARAPARRRPLHDRTPIRCCAAWRRSRTSRCASSIRSAAPAAAASARRYTASIFDFGRLNHRMHNKLFIADGVMAVAGGRNIADEYFLRAMDANFVDMDAFVMGAVVKRVSAIFDRYWNSEVVYPDRGRSASRSATGRRGAQALRRADREPAAVAADRPARRPTCSATARSARSFDAGQVGLAVGHRPRLRRPAREAAGDDAQGRVRDERHQRRDDAGLAGQERAGPDVAVHDPRREGDGVVPQPREGARSRSR